MREDSLAGAGHDPAVVLWSRGELLFGSRNVEVRIFAHPAVIKRGVVRNKIKHEANSAIAEAFSKAEQCVVAAEVFVHMVVANREAGSANIRFPEVR